MAKAATKRKPKAVLQLQMQVDEVAPRPLDVSPTERITADGEIIPVVIAQDPLPTPVTKVGGAGLDDREPDKEPFGRWLIAQVALRRGDAIGDLAKMAKADPGFPKQGDADAARRRIGMAGADPDTFEALDDAEREWDRL